MNMNANDIFIDLYFFIIVEIEINGTDFLYWHI